MGVPRLVSADADSGKLPDVVLDYLTNLLAADKTAAANVTKLRPWFAAQSRRGFAPVNILVNGDSIPEGYGGSDAAYRIPERIGSTLRHRLGTTSQDFGYIPAYYESLFNGAVFSSRVARAGSGIDSRRDPTYGLGRRSQRLAQGDSLTFTFTGTSFDIVYTQGPITGILNVVVDGGTASQVNTVNGAIVSGKTWRSATLADTSHTVVVTRDASSQTNEAYVEGLAWYRGTEARGLRVWDSSHAGYRATDFGAGTWAQAAQTSQADIVIGDFMANEYGQQQSINDYSAGLNAWRANLRSVLASAGKTYPIPFVLFAPPATGGNPQPITWAQYVAAAKAFADSDPYTVFVDLGKAMPSPIGSNPNANSDVTNLGLYTDVVHMTSAGQQMAGDYLADLLTIPARF